MKIPELNNHSNLTGTFDRWVMLLGEHKWHFKFSAGRMVGQMATRAGKQFVEGTQEVHNYKFNVWDYDSKSVQKQLHDGYGASFVGVMFRKDKEYGRIHACFPKIVTHGEFSMCYANIGQHSSYHHDWLLNDTVAATEDEYKELFEELCGLGYIPILITRKDGLLRSDDGVKIK